MTEHSLNRGMEMRSEIETLKSALGEASTNSLFKDYQGSCRGYIAQPFLVSVQMEVKILAVKMITERIEELQQEFDKL